ncbi:hypothetical protein F511_39443 [Dorcoceras hygrometricum]|uniref:Uncharacterized protein n=1 Tax=Dorcoceras hygrometricum TaxID=472368 RepID=A0A2Z7AGL3_9LAMI|nr:hypothetical protein F511_39443 [Dorcoceras hygrometricum]
MRGCWDVSVNLSVYFLLSIECHLAGVWAPGSNRIHRESGSSRDTASRGPTTIVTPKSQFWTCPTDHDSIGYPRMKASGESSTTKHRLLHASGPHPIPPPNDPNQLLIRRSPIVSRCFSNNGPGKGFMSTLVNGTVAGDRWIERSGFVVSSENYSCVMRSADSNAIIGVVTTGFECLPPSCDGLTGPDDHGPMISTG